MEIIKTNIGSKLTFKHFGTQHLRVDGCNEIRLTSRRNDILPNSGLVENGTSFDTPGISGDVSIVEIKEFLDFFCDSGTPRVWWHCSGRFFHSYEIVARCHFY